MRQFDVKRPGEKRTLTFDFTDDLPDGVTIDQVNSVTVIAWVGIDESASSLKDGNPAKSGALVLQSVTGGIAGVNYLFVARVTLSDGQILELPAVLPVRTVY